MQKEILGLINRTFTLKNEANMIKLWKSPVCPLLEYAVLTWTHYLQKDIKTPGGVQRRATKLEPSRRNKQFLIFCLFCKLEQSVNLP